VTALSAGGVFEVLGSLELFRRQRRVTATNAVTYYKRGAIALDSTGKAVKVTGTTGLKIVGWYEGEDFTATTGDRIEVMSGIIERKNSGTAAVTIADLEQVVFAEDDQTISRTSQGGTLSPCGILLAFVDSKPFVMMGDSVARLLGSSSQIQFATLTATATTITAAAGTETLSIGDPIPAGSVVLGVSMVLTTPFSGGTVADFTCDVGSNGDIDALVDGANLFAAAVDGAPSSMPAGIAPHKYFASQTQLQAKFICGSDDVGDATSGSVTIRVAYITLS